jgi:hypothetical protein
MMKVRPLSGSCTTCSCPITVPRPAVSARMIGTSPTIVTSSRMSPTAIVKSSRAF